MDSRSKLDQLKLKLELGVDTDSMKEPETILGDKILQDTNLIKSIYSNLSVNGKKII